MKGDEKSRDFSIFVNDVPFHIDDSTKAKGVCIIGVKNSGKTSKVFLPMAICDILSKEKNRVTVFTSNKDSFDLITEAAKVSKRLSKSISPSNDVSLCRMFYEKLDERFYIKDNLIDFSSSETKSVKNVSVINMEADERGNAAIRVNKKMLRDVFLKSRECTSKSRTPHYIYIDDAHLYMEEISLISNLPESHSVRLVISLDSFYIRGYSEIIKNNFGLFIFKDTVMMKDYFKREPLMEYKVLGKDFVSIWDRSEIASGKYSVSPEIKKIINQCSIESRKEKRGQTRGLIYEESIKNAEIERYYKNIKTTED